MGPIRETGDPNHARSREIQKGEYMPREETIKAIRERVPCTNYLEKSKYGMYICPFCGSGTGPHKTGALKVYPETNTWTCFRCKRSGDGIDLYMKETGADFNQAISSLSAQIGIETNKERTERKKPMKDFTAYYEECRGRLDDPRAVEYLKKRGISLETARKCGIGFDPEADPATSPGRDGGKYPCPRIIVPTRPDQYVGRAIIETRYPKMNSDGGKAGIFNQEALYTGSTVFICEGWADALSVMEAGADAIALNSKSNADILLNLLKERPTQARLVLALDNDEAGLAGMEKLEKGFQEMGITYTRADICGGAHDPNEALVSDRVSFLSAVQAAGGAELPGLLHYEDLLKTFQTADDRIIEIKAFPHFSKTAKIKVHGSVVIAADTGGGKSSLALNFVHSLNETYPCLYFNLEMDQLTVLQRLVAIASGMTLDRIEGYKQDPATAETVNLYLKQLTSRKPLQIIQDAYYLEDIEAIIRTSTAGREDPTMVFIDHSLLVDSKDQRDKRYERFTEVSESLRKMALKYNIVLFVLLQMNRAGKKDENAKPKNDSLKESGSWENDATQIIFLWKEPGKGKKLILTKNRNGASGKEFALNCCEYTQAYVEAFDAGKTDKEPAKKESKRDKERETFFEAVRIAQLKTGGKQTWADIADAADKSVAVVKRWGREYGHVTVNGVAIDPAGADEQVGIVQVIPFDGSVVQEDSISASF